ncbi:hypothetical protein HA402_007445 [Bradysia odoriphaga]|nr:hypothetical protein HA402_007445 [Bradysia odoriphaga]
MEINQKDNELHFYPINDNEYLGAIKVNVSNTRNTPSTTIILDQSGSMGSQFARFVKQIIPLVMSKLGYAEDYRINLITFNSEGNTYHLTSRELKNSDLEATGGTNFAHAIIALRTIMERCAKDSPNEPMRILTISDGEIFDPNEAAIETKKLMEFFAKSGLTINSQALRLFTSSSQPDTKALSYLLQINNTTATQLYDATVGLSDETIASEIVKLFQRDCFQNYQLLHFERSIVLKFPWNSHTSMRVILSCGWNIFWLKQVPTGVVKLGNDTVNVIVQNQFSLGMFHELMESKLEYITDHMIVLKIVGSSEANGMVNQVFECLKKQEDALAAKSSTSNKIISNLLDGIAKNKTNFKDSKQMAEFLRKTKAEIDNQRENDRRKREEEKAARIKKEEDEKAARIKKEEDEKAALKKAEEEKAARIKREEDEKAARKKAEEEKEAARVKQLEAEKAAEEEADRVKRLEAERAAEEEAARVKRLEAERAAEEEAARVKQLEAERAAEEEAARIKQQEAEKVAEEEAALIRREEEEREETNRKKQAEEDRKKREVECDRRAGMERLEKELDITCLKSNPDSQLDSIQTVFIFDEHLSGAKENQRFMEKIVPLTLSRLFYESSKLVHLAAFVRYKTTFEQLRQSLLQTLDAKMQIRILVLTNEKMQTKGHETDNFAEMLNRFLSVSNYSYELQVVRLVSSKVNH